MKDYELNRRRFLKVLASLPISLPMVSTAGYAAKLIEATVSGQILSPEESLKKLVLLLGPWSAVEREKSEDFARRFMKSGHVVGPYFPEASKLVQSLASRFPAGTSASKEIDLRKLPPKERALLMNLTKQLYNFIEVRFLISDEPQWGECQTDDRMRYTLAPKIRRP